MDPNFQFGIEKKESALIFFIKERKIEHWPWNTGVEINLGHWREIHWTKRHSKSSLKSNNKLPIKNKCNTFVILLFIYIFKGLFLFILMCFSCQSFLCFYMSAFFSAGFFMLQIFFRCQYFSMSTFCLCFGVEGEEFGVRDRKYMTCKDPVGTASRNRGMAWPGGKQKGTPHVQWDLSMTKNLHR